MKNITISKDCSSVGWNTAHLYEHIVIRRLFSKFAKNLYGLLSVDFSAQTYDNSFIEISIVTYDESYFKKIEKFIQLCDPLKISEDEVLQAIKDLETEETSKSEYNLTNLLIELNELSKTAWNFGKSTNITGKINRNDAILLRDNRHDYKSSSIILSTNINGDEQVFIVLLLDTLMEVFSKSVYKEFHAYKKLDEETSVKDTKIYLNQEFLVCKNIQLESINNALSKLKIKDVENYKLICSAMIQYLDNPNYSNWVTKKLGADVATIIDSINKISFDNYSKALKKINIQIL